MDSRNQKGNEVPALQGVDKLEAQVLFLCRALDEAREAMTLQANIIGAILDTLGPGAFAEDRRQGIYMFRHGVGLKLKALAEVVASIRNDEFHKYARE